MAVYLPAEKIAVRGGFILQKLPRFYSWAIRGGKSVSSTGHHICLIVFHPRHLRAMRCGVGGYE